MIYEEYVTLTFHVSVFVRFFYNFTNVVKKKNCCCSGDTKFFLFSTLNIYLCHNE